MIGSARDFIKRFNGYNSAFNRRKNSTHLQNFANKYGRETLAMELQELVDVRGLSKEERARKLFEREQHWIDFYNSADRKKGFNICPQAGTQSGHKWTEESRKNCRERLKKDGHPWTGRKHKEESKELIRRARLGKSSYNKGCKRTEEEKTNFRNAQPNNKPVCQYSLEGDLIKRWDSINMAAKTLDIGSGNIFSVISGRSLHAKGFVWKTSVGDDPIKISSILDAYEIVPFKDIFRLREKNPTPKQKKPYKRKKPFSEKELARHKEMGLKKRKGVDQLSLDNVLLDSYPSIKDAVIATGCDRACIIKCCKGQSETSKGFKWRYTLVEPKKDLMIVGCDAEAFGFDEE